MTYTSLPNVLSHGFYVAGEGPYEPGDRHTLEFKGITKDDILRAEYLVLPEETDESRGERLRREAERAQDVLDRHAASLGEENNPLLP